VLSLATLLAAAAAFIAAGAHSVHVLTAPAPAPVTVTLPPPDRKAELLADLARGGHTSASSQVNAAESLGDFSTPGND
jgi:hypothetical protein